MPSTTIRKISGNNIIPGIIEKKSVYSHIFQGYWEDIGTIKSFYESNLSCTKIVPEFNFFDAANPITHSFETAPCQ